MQYFGSNNVEGVAEDWMEIKMSCLFVAAVIEKCTYDIAHNDNVISSLIIQSR